MFRGDEKKHSVRAMIFVAAVLIMAWIFVWQFINFSSIFPESENSQNMKITNEIEKAQTKLREGGFLESSNSAEERLRMIERAQSEQITGNTSVSTTTIEERAEFMKKIGDEFNSKNK